MTWLLGGIKRLCMYQLQLRSVQASRCCDTLGVPHHNCMTNLFLSLLLTILIKLIVHTGLRIK